MLASETDADEAGAKAAGAGTSTRVEDSGGTGARAGAEGKEGTEGKDGGYGYRLWGPDGVKVLGPLARPVGKLLLFG
jgi:hypothetical protein